MRRFLGTLMAAALILVSVGVHSVSAVAPCNGGKYITVYEDTYYGSKSLTLCSPGSSDLRNNAYPGGVLDDCNSSYPNTGWDNCISSFIIGGASSTHVCLYTQYGYSGYVWDPVTSKNNLDVWVGSHEGIGDRWSDVISSIRFDSTSPYC